uniref:Glycerol-3-phosphate acyltransferase n=1 Tax=candidate division WOR-3 bacterium TaxID=2052148 RepID=A0A7C6A922_UNCW3
MCLFVLIPKTADSFAGYFVSFFFGFILGAIPFGYLMGRIKKIDIRRYGSGNIGFTNVNRVLGFWFALPVLLFDFAKGFLPTLFASRLELLPTWVGTGALFGHIFSPFLKFRGGKGVATLFGVALALTPVSFVLSIGLFAIILFAFSYVSLASISFALALPIITFILNDNQTIFFFTLLFGIMLILTHRSNIRRLVKKQEAKFSIKK